MADGGQVGSDPKSLEVIYNCRKKGTAEVTVTIVLPRYEMVEFSWEKECGAKIVVTEKVWTANQLMVLFSMSALAVVAVITFVYLRYKKRKAERERSRLAALRAEENVETF